MEHTQWPIDGKIIVRVAQKSQFQMSFKLSYTEQETKTTKYTPPYTHSLPIQKDTFLILKEVEKTTNISFQSMSASP